MKIQIEISPSRTIWHNQRANLVILRDITERKRAEEALRLEKENFRHSLDESPLGMRIVTADGDTLYANRAILDVYGYDSLEELRKIPLRARYTPESYAEFQKRKQQRERGDFSTSKYEISIVKKNGEVRHLQVDRKEVLWNNAKQFLVVYQDITERKLAEEAGKRAHEALRESERKNRALIEAIPDAIFRVSRDGIFLDVPVGKDSTLALPRSAFVGKRVDELFPEDLSNMALEAAERALRSGTLQVLEYEMPVPSGTKNLRDYEARIVPCGPDEVLAISRDITERKLAEQALRESEERFRGLFENVFEGIYRSTQGGKLLIANPALVRMLGYASEEELLSIEVSQLYINPDDRGRLAGILEEEGEVRNFELNLKRKDGQKIVVLENARTVRDGQGSLLYYEGTLTDITERKRAEEALRQSEEQYRSLVEAAPDVIYTISAEDGSLTSLNLAFERLTGWSRAEWLGKPFMGIVHPDDLSTAVETFQKASRGEAPPSYQLRILSKSGEYMVGEFTTTPLVKGGKVVGELGIARDVTERKRAEEALAESERKLKTLFEILPVGASILDAQRKIVYANPALERVLDISAESLIKGDYRTRRYLRPDGTLMPAEEFASVRAVKERGPVHNVETGVVKEDGAAIWTSVSAVPLGLPDWEVLVVTSDITERKRAEEALRVSLEKYRVLFESFPLGITISDKSGKIIEVNRQSERLLGITRDAHAERRINSKEWQIVRKDGTLMPVDEFASTRALQENRPIENVEMGIVKDKGEITWINVTAAPIPLEDYGVAIAYGDITDRKLAEERVKTTQEQLHLLAGHLQSVREEERKHLAQEFHDQLGQVLTALKMDLSMLHRTLADPGRELSRTAMALGIESMQGMIDRAIGIIREILSELRPELLDQLGIVPTLEWEAERFQRHSGISCTFSSTVEDIGLDAKKSIALYRILQEALTNVARHAKATSVEVTLRKESGDLILEIKDNGVGISADAEHKARSFGLIGMRERAILLGGTLEIGGVEGKGTTILVRIPYEQTNTDGGAAL